MDDDLCVCEGCGKKINLKYLAADWWLYHILVEMNNVMIECPFCNKYGIELIQE